MGDAAGPAAGLSLAATGFKMAGDYEKAQGVSSEDTYRAEQLDRASQYGELKGVQTNAQMTRNLAITLGQLDSIRGAQRVDPTSPTSAAVRDFNEQVGTEQKTIKVDSIMAQAQEDEANAAYLRDASSKALLAGDISMGGDFLGGLGGAIKSAG